jgi:hypothetical protein
MATGTLPNKNRRRAPLERRQVLLRLELPLFELLQAAADNADPPRPLAYAAREAIERGLLRAPGASKK